MNDRGADRGVPRLRVRAVGTAVARHGRERLAAHRIRVRGVQRAHRAARHARRSGATRPARHLSQRFLRTARTPLRRGRLRLSRRRPDRRQRDRRQDHPAARRGRAARHALRPRVQTRPRARLPPGHALPHHRMVLADRAPGARPHRTAGFLHPARDRGDPVRGRAARREPAAGGPVRSAGQRAHRIRHP